MKLSSLALSRVAAVAFAFAFAFAWSLAGCIAEVGPSNPYDPEVPVEQQQKARLAGVVVGGAIGGTPAALEGAAVTLSGPSSPTNSPLTTTADGAFAFDALVPGTYSLEVTHAAHLSSARDVVLAPGDERELTVTLVAIPAGLGAGQGQLTGTIYREGELGFATAQQDHSGITVELVGTGVRTTTNVAGRFDLFLSPGSYSATLTAPNYVSQTVSGVTVTAGAQTQLPGSPLTLISNPGTLSGVVTREGATDHSLTQVEVVEAAVEGTAGADGSYTVVGVPAGRYTVLFSFDDFDTEALTGVEVVGGRTTAVPDVGLALSRGGIRGAVTLAGSTDASGVLIEVVGTSFSTVTNASGAYEVAGVPVGTYSVRGSKEGYSTSTVPTVTVASGAVTTATVLSLPVNPGEVAGTVALEGSADASSASVSLEGDATYSGTVAANGAFTVTGVRAGAYRLVVSASGYTSQTLLGIVVTPGDTTSAPMVSLRLPRGTLQGQVTLSDSNTSLLDSVRLRLKDSGGGTVASAVAEPTGAYRFNDVGAGVTYSLTAELDGYRAARLDGVSAVADTVTNLTTLTLSPTTGSFDIVEAPYTNSSTVTLGLDNSAATGMRISLDSTFGGGAQAFVTYAAAPTFSIGTGDGDKVVYVQFCEGSAQPDCAGGTITDPALSATVTLDQTAPVVTSFVIDADATYTNDTGGQVRLSIAVSDATSGVVDMKLSNDTTFNETEQDYATSVDPHTLAAPSTDGVKTVYAVFRDRAGNTTAPGNAFTGVIAAATSDSIELDTTEPALTSMTLGCGSTVGASHCSSALVTVTLAPTTPEATTTMAFSSTGSFAGATFVPFTSTASFLLTPEDGSRTVYVQLRDAAGNATSGTDSDSIILDTAAPTLTASLSGTGLDGPSSVLVSAATVTVTLSGVDETTGAADLKMQLSDYPNFTSDGTAALPWIAYATSVAGRVLPDSATDGLKRVYVRIRDQAGNTAEASPTITLDTAKPAIDGVAFADGIDAQGLTAVDDTATTLEVLATGADEMRITGDITDSFKNTWISIASLVSVTLSTGDGDKTVTVEVRDDAGNVPAGGASPTSRSATVRLDETAPVSVTFTARGFGPSASCAATNWSNSMSVPVVITAGDARATNGSGIADFQISEDSGFSGAVWQQWPNPTQASVTVPFGLSGSQGEHQLYVRARDYAGLSTSASTVCVNVDTLPPESLLATPDSLYSQGGAGDPTRYWLAGYDAAQDGLAGLELRVRPGSTDAATPVPGAWFAWPGQATTGTTADDYLDVEWSGGAGSKRVTFEARDAAGNVATFPALADVLVDQTAPTRPEISYAASRNRGAVLSWSAATDTGGAGVAYYRVLYRQGKPGVATDAPTTLSYDGFKDTTSRTVTVDELENERHYLFRVVAVDAAGNTTALAGTDPFAEVSVGWSLHTVATNAARRLVPQDVAYHQGKLYVLYHEEESLGGVRAALAMLAVSADGGATWTTTVVEDPDEPAYGAGPIKGRVDSRLVVGREAVSVITVAAINDPIGGGFDAWYLMLAEYRTEDDGLRWRRSKLYPADGAVAPNDKLGDAATSPPAAAFPLEVAAKGSSRVVYFTIDDEMLNPGVQPALMRMRSADDTAAQWSPAVKIHDVGGARYSACNANYLDRLVWTKQEVTTGYFYAMASPFRGAGSFDAWVPKDLNGGAVDPGYTVGQPSGDGKYAFATVACAALNDTEWFYVAAVDEAGHLHWGFTPEFAQFELGVDAGDVQQLVVNASPALADDSSPPAAYAGGAALYLAYRGNDGSLRVAKNANPTVLAADNVWRLSLVDPSGDAGYNPVMSGYVAGSPIIASTDLQGHTLKLARAAVLAPQAAPETSSPLARYEWSPTPGAEIYRVTEMPAAICSPQDPTASNSAIPGTATTLEGPACIEVSAFDDLAQRGPVGERWMLSPFAGVATQLESGGSTLSSSFSPANGIDSNGDVVAVLSASPSEVAFFYSTDAGQTFSLSPVVVAATSSTDRDIAVSRDTVAGKTYIHVIYRDTSVASIPLAYRRYDVDDILNPTAAVSLLASAVGDLDIGEQPRFARAQGGLLGVVALDQDQKKVWYRRSSDHGSTWMAQKDVLGGPAPFTLSSPSFVEHDGAQVAISYIEALHVSGTPRAVQMVQSANGGGVFSAAVTACQGGDATCNPNYAQSARHNQFYVVGMTSSTGSTDKSVRVSVIGEGSPDFPLSGQGQTAWSTITLEDKQDVVIDQSLDLQANEDGVYFVYSTCSDYGLATAWRLNLAYCSRDCHSVESWVVSTVLDETNTAESCGGNWFNGLALRVDPDTDRIYIAYTRDPAGVGPTAVTRNVLRGGYIKRAQ